MLAATYFDGKSARRHVVVLEVADGVATIRGDALERSERLADLRVSEPTGAAPRLITFPDGAVCEVRDHAAFAELLAQTGHRDSAVVRWQSRLRPVVLALVLLVAVVGAGLRWGLPLVAEAIAARLPDAVLVEVGERALRWLDDSLLQPSEVPEARQRALAARFAELGSAAGPAPRLAFRSSRQLGANALALPSGTVVVTDDMVRLARDDEELLGVFAHELGHVEARHGLRLMLQSSIVGALFAWTLGDVSGLLATAPALLVGAKYSRDFESEADAAGARLLTARGLSPERLADLLERLDATQGSTGDARGAAAAYLASHPAARERIAALRLGGAR